MSDLAEFKKYLARLTRRDFGHRLGWWRWSPESDGTPGYRANCTDCDGVVEIMWDRDTGNWVADGDLVVCTCGDEHNPRHSHQF